MTAIEHSPEFLKKRKFLMVLPLLTLPFVTVLFYLFGGGKGTAAKNELKNIGLNTTLPDAHFNKKREPNKFSLYESMTQDSAKWLSAVKNDPNRKDSDSVQSMSFEHSQVIQDILKNSADKFPGAGYEKLNMSVSHVPSQDRGKELSERLKQLQDIVNTKPQSNFDPEHPVTEKGNAQPDLLAESIKKTETSYSPDPDLVQLDKMLDKIQAIQRPEMVKDSPITLRKSGPINTSFQTNTGENTVRAMIAEKQILISGATIKLQVMDSVKIDSYWLSPGQLIYGTVTLSNERLKIQVRSLRLDNRILSVHLSVYDLDGMEGIFVPGSMSRDVSKQSIDQGLSSIGLAGIDPSIGAQAASAGIQAAKTLISRKVKLIEVTIPTGYQILIKSEQE